MLTMRSYLTTKTDKASDKNFFRNCDSKTVTAVKRLTAAINNCKKLSNRFSFDSINDYQLSNTATV